ncbi:MAG: phosphoribosyltransferase [Phycisphaerales bacterium]
MARLTNIITKEILQARVRALREHIFDDYRHCDSLVLIPVLNGAIRFCADIMRGLHQCTELCPIMVSSRTGMMQHETKVQYDIRMPQAVPGQHVLIVEDLLDTGTTLAEVVAKVDQLGPRDLQVAVLLDKEVKRTGQNAVRLRYSGFRVPDRWICGYGIDYMQRFRELNHISYIELSDEEKSSDVRHVKFDPERQDASQVKKPPDEDRLA